MQNIKEGCPLTQTSVRCLSCTRLTLPGLIKTGKRRPQRMHCVFVCLSALHLLRFDLTKISNNLLKSPPARRFSLHFQNSRKHTKYCTCFDGGSWITVLSEFKKLVLTWQIWAVMNMNNKRPLNPSAESSGCFSSVRDVGQHAFISLAAGIVEKRCEVFFFCETS